VAVHEDGRDPTLRDYVRVMWRRKWLVLGVAAILTALALAYSFAKTPLYKASAQLVYESQLNVGDPLSVAGGVDSAELQLELSGVDSALASPDLVEGVEVKLGSAVSESTDEISAAPDSDTGSTASSNTVSITAVSPSAEMAARVANAYADAFVDSRKAREQARVRQAEQVIQSRLDTFRGAALESADYLTLQQRLQDLQILEATVTGNFRVLVPATVPQAPFSPKPLRNGLIALMGGLVIGVGLALLLDQFDTRVRTQEDAVALLSMPLLGRIPKLPPKTLNEQPLVVLSESHSPAAEAVRKLRGNLEFANVDGDLESLFITSCLQGEGKSLTACNLALSLAASGNNVVLVDADLRRPQVHRYLNLTNTTGVSTVLSGKTDLREALSTRSVGPSVATVLSRRSSRPSGSSRNRAAAAALDDVSNDERPDNLLHVLTSGPIPPNPAEIVASRSFAALMTELRDEFDTVIVDAPALLAVGDTAAIAPHIDGILFLVDLTRATRPLLTEAATQIARMPCRILGLVVIGRPPSRHYEHYHYLPSHQDESPGEPNVRTRGSENIATSQGLVRTPSEP